MHEGTSQSAGFVAGAAALLLAAHRAAGHNASGADMRDPLMRGVLPSAALTNKCGAGVCTYWMMAIFGDYRIHSEAVFK